MNIQAIFGEFNHSIISSTSARELFVEKIHSDFNLIIANPRSFSVGLILIFNQIIFFIISCVINCLLWHRKYFTCSFYIDPIGQFFQIGLAKGLVFGRIAYKVWAFSIILEFKSTPSVFSTDFFREIRMYLAWIWFFKWVFRFLFFLLQWTFHQNFFIML